MQIQIDFHGVAWRHFSCTSSSLKSNIRNVESITHKVRTDAIEGLTVLDLSTVISKTGVVLLNMNQRFSVCGQTASLCSRWALPENVVKQLC